MFTLDFRHAENLKSTLKNSLDDADLEKDWRFCKIYGGVFEFSR